MNLLTAGIPLGRWFGIQVTLSWLFIVYAVMSVHDQLDAIWFVLLFATVLLHEFGHSLTCKAVGGTADHIVLGPWGGVAFVSPPPRPWPSLWTTIGGPAVNLVLIPVFMLLRHYTAPVSPFRMMGDPDVSLASFYYAFVVWEGVRINVALLGFNLLPIFPMDGGRIFQEVLWFFIGFPRSLLIAGMVGTVGGAVFIVLGLGLYQIDIPLFGITLGNGVNSILACMGFFAAMESFRIYQQAQFIMAKQRR